MTEKEIKMASNMITQQFFPQRIFGSERHEWQSMTVGTDMKSHKILGEMVWKKIFLKLFKSFQWSVEAGVSTAGSMMKYSNHNMNQFITISWLNEF